MKVEYVKAVEGSVTLHLTVDEASLIRALIGVTSEFEMGTRLLFDALVDAGIPRKYKVLDESKRQPYGLHFKERE